MELKKEVLLTGMVNSRSAYSMRRALGLSVNRMILAPARPCKLQSQFIGGGIARKAEGNHTVIGRNVCHQVKGTDGGGGGVNDMVRHMVQIQIQVDPKTGISAGGHNVFWTDERIRSAAGVQSFRTVGGKRLLQISQGILILIRENVRWKIQPGKSSCTVGWNRKPV